MIPSCGFRMNRPTEVFIELRERDRATSVRAFSDRSGAHPAALTWFLPSACRPAACP